MCNVIFFFTRTHSIIQIRRIVISGICYDFVVCSLVVWFILVKIQVLWIFFCTFWLLVMTLLFLWFISFLCYCWFLSWLYYSHLFSPRSSSGSCNVFLVFVFSICPSFIFILLPCFALRFSCVPYIFYFYFYISLTLLYFSLDVLLPYKLGHFLILSDLPRST